MNEDEVVSPQALGPGAIEESGLDPEALLNGASESEYVDVLNPLSSDFIGQFGVTRPVQAEVTISPTIDGQRLTEAQATQTYGVPRLTNPARSGRANITNKVKIPAGQTVRLLGSEAQVIVRQLVTLIMQLEGKKNQLADKFARRQVEERVVQGRGSIMDVMGRNPVTVSEQLRDAIKPMEQELEVTNEVPDAEEEVEFPSIAGGVEAVGDAPVEVNPVSQPAPATAHVFVDEEKLAHRRTKRPRANQAKKA